MLYLHFGLEIIVKKSNIYGIQTVRVYSVRGPFYFL